MNRITKALLTAAIVVGSIVSVPATASAEPRPGMPRVSYHCHLNPGPLAYGGGWYCHTSAS